jgi:phosphatidylglycerol:prolipoprotein diacylglycerol transferase
MYPDLSYLFHDLIGTQPDNWLSIFKTFGFFLAIAFLVSAVVYHAELKRKAAEGWYQPVLTQVKDGAPPSWGDAAGNALVGLFLLGKGVYAYQHFNEFRMDPASVLLSAKMHWPAGLLGAAVLGGLMVYERWRKRDQEPKVREVQVYPHDRISEITVAAAIGGILGAKFFDLFDNWESFLRDPIGSLTSGGGLAIYGGLLLGFVAVTWYLRRHNIAFWPSADAVAPALVAGYGVGRIGCQLSGDGDWGIVNNAPNPGWLPDWLWATRYPHNVINSVDTEPVRSVPIEGCTWDYCMQLGEPVFPTPLYETLSMVVVFAILWALRKRLRTPGLLFFLYIMLISIERFFIEKIRVNVEYEQFGNLSQAELISIALFIVSIAGMVYVSRRHRPSTT